jgi:S1-C subfamily serine protease
VQIFGSGAGTVLLDGNHGGPRLQVYPQLFGNSWSGVVNGPWSDVELVTLTPALGEYFGTDDGVLVVRAGRASELGVRDGDVILDIGGREPQSPEHALRILATFEPGESLQASIMRQRRRETLAITVPTGTDWGAAPR